MEIRSNDKIYIIAPLSPKLGKYETGRIVKELDSELRATNVAIDLSNVSDCTVEFIESIKEISKSKRVGIFNIQSDIFALFNYMHLDKCVNLFVSELDFVENTRHLINRSFRLV